MANNTITEQQKKKLRNAVIQGAANYAHHLIDKDFLVLCEDGKEYTVQFFKSDFRHLTGISSNLSDDDFFKSCYSRTLDVGNINTLQKYNWNTLKSKAKRVAEIHRIIFDNIQGTLFLINLHTNTRDFPVAIKNTNIEACVGFIAPMNNARTMRKYANSNVADEQKKICAIFSKKKDTVLYDNIVYVSEISSIYQKDSKILDVMSENIQNKFLELLTRPE